MWSWGGPPHWLPPACLAIGVVLPSLSALALRGIGLAAFCLVLFGLLTMTAGRATRADLGPTAVLVVAASAIAPALADRLAWVLDVPPGLHIAIVVFAAAPIAQSVGPLAAMLGLPDRAATFAALITVLLAPVVLPAAVSLSVGGTAGLAGDALVHRVAILALLPALIAFALRQALPAQVAEWRLDFRGLVLLALAVVAAAAGQGIRGCLAEPSQALQLGAVAIAVMATAMGCGWVLTRRFGTGVALAGLYACGARNMGFAWAAVAPDLDADGTRFVNLTVLLFFLLPWMMRRLMRWAANEGCASTPGALPAGRPI